MRIREDNRNMVLLTTVTLCCGAVAGALALLAPAPEKQIADRSPIESASPTSVRVVGAAFVPNVNPRQR